MLTEEWRPAPVEPFGDFYEISDLGRVRSVDRMRTGINGPQRCDGKVIRHRVNKVGYPQVSLWKNGKGRTFNVHRLVAIAFVPNPDGLPMVNHIDGIKTNADATNLEWTDDFANKMHAIRIGRITGYKKLLTADEVARIRRLAGTMTQTQIAKIFGTTQTNVSLILMGRTH